MSHPRLLVSFQHVCLENLPVGSFTHRRVKAATAKALIDKARAAEALLGVTQDDILAPHKKHEAGDHAALRRVLDRHFGIKLSIKDFCSEDDGLYFANPLSLFAVKERDRLLIVTCNYSLGKKDPLQFKIAADSVEFHLIQEAR
jgi:hypothetical protein